MSFIIQKMELPEVLLIEKKLSKDHRGFFTEAYKKSVFTESGFSQNFVQDNFSHSRMGVLRGLHYQKNPKAQGKLVMALRGEIFDVAVDIRRGSPNYGKWVGVKLSTINFTMLMLYTPPGFAHGFCVISEEADVLYKVTEEYAPELERGIIWNDPSLGIQWPTKKPILSSRDQELPNLENADNNFSL